MKQIKDYVDEFSTHIGTAIQAIDNAAKTYVAALKEYPETAQFEFSKRFPQITENTWNKLRCVGYGDAYPSLLLFSDKFAKKIVRMPREVQDEVLNGDSFDWYNPKTEEVEKVPYADLLPRNEKILFDDDRAEIRSIPAQVAYARVLAAERKQHNKPYTVYSDHLKVHEACQIGKNELEDIIGEME